ncbi:DedA family protein [Halorarum salinum]|uniref:VTT domain-containing protein n=1 Tax=Halorarum salinum TaxID=2743089 RepID=A0A7D5L9P7_9EURY|nr:VTT domain-containing protein [Halobaculum salinum]QLG61009.1 VTT domain-containing protein [Halobaculum salinum]
MNVPLQSIVGEFPPWLEGLLSSEWAYVVLFGVFVLEGAMLMYFVPSELVVPGSLVLLGHSPDRVLAILGIAVLGATIGQFALFKLAQRGGREWLLRKRWFRVSEDTLDRFDGWFDRWGPIVVPVSNSLLFTRGMLTVPAGLSEMDDRQFVVLSAIGTLCFEAALAGLYVFSVGLLW